MKMEIGEDVQRYSTFCSMLFPEVNGTTISFQKRICFQSAGKQTSRVPLTIQLKSPGSSLFTREVCVFDFRCGPFLF